MDLNTVKNLISELMDEERFNHSLGVMELSGELAELYGIDSEKASFTGLIHDVAKRFPKEEQKKLMEKAYALLPEDPIVFTNGGLWHGPAGAVYAKEKFNVDEEIYNAIFYHTIGKKDMSLFEKIIFLADIIEINRDNEFEWAKDAREIAKEDLDRALCMVLDKSINSLLERGLVIHPNSILLRNEIVSSFKEKK